MLNIGETVRVLTVTELERKGLREENGFTIENEFPIGISQNMYKYMDKRFTIVSIESKLGGAWYRLDGVKRSEANNYWLWHENWLDPEQPTPITIEIRSGFVEET